MKIKNQTVPDVRLPTAKERIIKCCRAIITASETDNETMFNNNVLFISMAIDELNKDKKELPF